MIKHTPARSCGSQFLFGLPGLNKTTGTDTRYKQCKKLTPKKVRCGHGTPMRTGMINKHRNKHKLLVSNENGTIIKKTGNRQTVSETLSSNFLLLLPSW